MKVRDLKNLVIEGGFRERVPTRKQDLIEIALKDFNEKFDTKDWKG